MTPEIVIRASSLSQYADCPRRFAARSLKHFVVAAGYELVVMGNGIGAAIGSAVHAGAALTLIEKARTGTMAPESAALDAATDSLRKAAEEGITFDRETPVLNDAELQAIRMTRVYRAQVAPDVEPLIVEERLEAQVSLRFVLSGQSDVIAREPGRLRDLKTGKARSNHKPQLGAYSLLARSNGIAVTEASEDFIPRVALKKAQPDAQIYMHDLAAAETAAVNVLRHIEADLAMFTQGDAERDLVAGDPWAFAANPSSKLCSGKWCPAFGTDFCREHQTFEEE